MGCGCGGAARALPVVTMQEAVPGQDAAGDLEQIGAALDASMSAAIANAGGTVNPPVGAEQGAVPEVQTAG